MSQYLQPTFPDFGTPRNAIKILSRDEADRFLAGARLGLERDFVMCELALFTGLRCAELVGLNIEHVAPYGVITPTLTVTADIAKGHNAREIPLNAQLRLDIEHYLDISAPGPREDLGWRALFISRKTGRRLSTRDFQRITRKLGCDILGHPVNPHMLRHTFATGLLRHSNTSVVQNLLGHSSLQSTQIYLHPGLDEMAAAIDQLSTSAPPSPQQGGSTC